MAARTLTKDQLKKAVGEHCASTGQAYEEDGKGNFLLGDVIVKEDGGKLVCDHQETKEAIANILMEMNEAEVKSVVVPNKKPNKLATIPSQGSSLTLEKVRAYFCEKATDEECQFALEVCAIRGLNPFKKDCHFVKYGGADPKLEILVSKDYFLKKAMSHPDFEHFKAGVTVSKGDEIRNVDRYYAYPGEKLIGGWAEAKRKSIAVPFRAEIPLEGFQKDNKFWKSQPGPGHMIRKCASTTVLREAYPEEFGGLYDVDEMGINPENEVGA